VFLPSGSQDDIGFVVSSRNTVYEIFRRVATLRGYKEISTPVVEYANTFTNPFVGMKLQTMLKWFNGDGEIEVLRPDWTTAIARALRNQNSDQQKWTYQGSVFRREKPGVESRQVGIELIRTPSLLGESECLLTANHFLSQLQAKEFVIELGHTGIFEELSRSLTLSEEQAEDLRSAMHDKRKDEVYRIVKSSNSKEAAEELAELVHAYGPFEMIDQYETRWKDRPLLLDIIRHLKKLANILRESGLDDLLIDLGRVKNLPYYSGTMFRGYFKESGTICFSGGRYDHLYDQFDKSISAVGLAFDVDILAAQLLQQETRKKLLVIASDDSLAFAETLRRRFGDFIVDVQYELPSDETYDKVVRIQKTVEGYEVIEL
jgi:ATP phosphoribosyltransferase regulatory subunit